MEKRKKTEEDRRSRKKKEEGRKKKEARSKKKEERRKKKEEGRAQKLQRDGFTIILLEISEDLQKERLQRTYPDNWEDIGTLAVMLRS